MMVYAGAAASPGVTLAATLESWTEGPRPRFALNSLSDGPVDLASFGGRVVLVHFFATWCEPCRAEMASLQRLADRYANRPVTILAVNVAEVAPRVRRFFETQPVVFPVLLDGDRAITKTWRVELLPTTVVLDTHLAPVLVANGDLDWDRADIDKALTALLPKQAGDAEKKPD